MLSLTLGEILEVIIAVNKEDDIIALMGVVREMLMIPDIVDDDAPSKLLVSVRTEIH